MVRMAMETFRPYRRADDVRPSPYDDFERVHESMEVRQSRKAP